MKVCKECGAIPLVYNTLLCREHYNEMKRVKEKEKYHKTKLLPVYRGKQCKLYKEDKMAFWVQKYRLSVSSLLKGK